ncbi:hypothetical protein BH23ACT10_BH23ACT10_00630 [soil metagenome]
MSIIEQTPPPGPAPSAATGTAPPPVDPPLRIHGEQADRLLRCSRWQ